MIAAVDRRSSRSAIIRRAFAPMTILESLVLGVVQGLTEFLPISSTAHLRLVPALLGWGDPGAALSAVLQCGTLVAAVGAMRTDIARLVGGLWRGLRAGRPLATADGRLAVMIAVGTLPIVCVGFAARHLIRGEARRLEVVAAALLAGTALMAAAEFARMLRRRPGRDGLDQVSFRDGVVMGCIQSLALVPGMSRSGVTISSGMLTGLDRATAARLSFLLSLPAVAAAGVLEAWQQRHEIFGTAESAAAAAVGVAAAAVVGYASIRWLLRLLTSRTLWPFIGYRLVVAAALAAGLAAGGLAPVVGAAR
jgi:undecaprenyl-diphosphatase